MRTIRVSRPRLLAGIILGLGGAGPAAAAEPAPIPTPAPVYLPAPPAEAPTAAYAEAPPAAGCATCGKGHGVGGGCANGQCGGGAGAGIGGAPGSNGPKCGSHGLVIYPRFEKHYIKKFCAPTICPGSCFGYFQTKWTPWQSACPQWQAGVQGYDPAIVERNGSPPPLGRTAANSLPLPITPPRVGPAGSEAVPPKSTLPTPRSQPQTPPAPRPAPQGTDGAVEFQAVPRSADGRTRSLPASEVPQEMTPRY